MSIIKTFGEPLASAYARFQSDRRSVERGKEGGEEKREWEEGRPARLHNLTLLLWSSMVRVYVCVCMETQLRLGRQKEKEEEEEKCLSVCRARFGSPASAFLDSVS